MIEMPLCFGVLTWTLLGFSVVLQILPCYSVLSRKVSLFTFVLQKCFSLTQDRFASIYHYLNCLRPRVFLGLLKIPRFSIHLRNLPLVIEQSSVFLLALFGMSFSWYLLLELCLSWAYSTTSSWAILLSTSDSLLVDFYFGITDVFSFFVFLKIFSSLSSNRMSSIQRLLNYQQTQLPV